ncbi:DEAD/DEAH box helicase [soil metagenome]
MPIEFKDLGFHESLMESLDAMGFSKATPIQELAIPQIVAGKDLIGCAQTGTGKTAAFLLPVIDYLVKNPTKEKGIRAMVIVPTRELATQIDQQMEGFSYFVGLSSLAIYGGGDSMGWDQQRKALEQGADLIIATPGRLIAHLAMGYVKMDTVEFLILDEADRMLDMGFYDDLMSIITKLPAKRQNLMFSATMPPKIREMANKILNEPVQVNLALSKPAEGVLQSAYLVYDTQKLPLIKHLLKDKDLPSIIVFCSRKNTVREINRELQKSGLKSRAISSDLEQNEREEVLLAFRNRKLQILVATDVLSRGIDIKDINLVINYDVPGDAEDYVHRVGRTARASTTGVAITLINEFDMSRFGDIEKLIERVIPKEPLPEALGEGPVYDPKKKFGRPSAGGRSGGGGGKGRSGGGGGGQRSGGGAPRGDKPSSGGAPRGDRPKGGGGGNRDRGPRKEGGPRRDGGGGVGRPLPPQASGDGGNSSTSN